MSTNNINIRQKCLAFPVIEKKKFTPFMLLECKWSGLKFFAISCHWLFEMAEWSKSFCLSVEALCYYSLCSWNEQWKIAFLWGGSFKICTTLPNSRLIFEFIRCVFIWGLYLSHKHFVNHRLPSVLTQNARAPSKCEACLLAPSEN